MKQIIAKNVDAYFASFPIKVQRLLKQMRKTIRTAEGGTQRTLSFSQRAQRKLY